MPVYSSSSDPVNSGSPTVGALIDRVYRDYLHPADDQPVVLTLTNAVDDSETDWTVGSDTLAPDEEALLAPGVLIEAGREQARITAVNDTVITVLRGVNGTEANAHDAAAELRVAPTFPRQSVFDAVCDNVVNLYPDLWREGLATVTSDTAPVDVAADIVTITEARYFTANGRPVPVSVELIRDYPPSATGQAVVFHDTPAGKTVYLSREARFVRPTAESDDLSADFGIDGAWDRIIIVGAAAQLLAGRDLDALDAAFITEQLEREVLPTRDVGDMRNRLLQYHQLLLRQARRNLRATRTVPIVMSR